MCVCVCVCVHKQGHELLPLIPLLLLLLLLLLLYICADGKNQATQQERAEVIQGIIYVENHDAEEKIQKLSCCNQIKCESQ